MAAIINSIPGGDDISLGAAPTLLYTADGSATASEPISVTIQNLHAIAHVTIGGSNVGDESNGVVLDAQYDSVTVPLRYPGATVYGYSDTASTPITVTVA